MSDKWDADDTIRQSKASDLEVLLEGLRAKELALACEYRSVFGQRRAVQVDIIERAIKERKVRRNDRVTFASSNVGQVVGVYEGLERSFTGDLWVLIRRYTKKGKLRKVVFRYGRGIIPSMEPCKNDDK